MFGSGIPSVLIVEDDETVRVFLCRALERAGHHPIGVRSGEEALEHVRGNQPIAAVLIDGILPDMHGVRLAEAMLAEPAGAALPICFVTGALRGNRQPTAGVGALGKPFRFQELTDMVDALQTWRDAGGSPMPDRQAALRHLEEGFLVGP